MLDWIRTRLGRGASTADASHASAVDSAPHIGLTVDLPAAIAQFNLGVQQLVGHRPEAAERYFRQALRLHPEFAEAAANLGSLLKDRGERTEAEQLLVMAVKLKPDLGPACFNLAMLCVDQARWADAAPLLKRSLARDPAQADAQYWLGNALMGLGDAAGARKAYRAAIQIDASHVQARWGHAMAQLPALPESDEEQAPAPAAFARELDKLKHWFKANPAAKGYLAVGAVQPYYLAYIARNHREVLTSYGSLCVDLMSVWSKEAGLPAPAVSGKSKCRLGIVSAHIHSHSVWHAVLRGWIEHLDRDRFELQIFHTGSVRDAETEWASRHVAKLHHGKGHWSSWAKVISDNRLDILIYPEIGMDATSSRLSALRLAPTQLAAWGHPITSGLPTMDGFISAQGFEPPDAAQHYSEKLLRLPRLGCCYRAFGTQPQQPDFSAWGIGPADKVLLCAGTAYKYAPRHDALLVEIARRCRPCKLIFFRSANPSLANRLEQRLKAAFAQAKMDFDECVRFIPWQSQATFFALLDRADIYLDSIGFSGFNTTMQAMERGTPVVAFEGEFMRGRFASAILRQLGLDEWVAGSTQEYVALVARLAGDEGHRLKVRQSIAERRSQLFDDRETVSVLGKELLALCRKSA